MAMLETRVGRPICILEGQINTIAEQTDLVEIAAAVPPVLR